MVKLYCKHKNGERDLGTFTNQQKAEAFWGLFRKKLQELYGKDIQPIYIKTGKGASK